MFRKDCGVAKGVVVAIFTDCLHYMNHPSGRSRKQYGAPTRPLRKQGAINKVLRDILNLEGIRATVILSISETQLQKWMQKMMSCRACLTRLEPCLRSIRFAIPVFRLTQGEIKGIFKGKQEMQEREALQLLVQRKVPVMQNTLRVGSYARRDPGDA